MSLLTTFALAMRDDWPRVLFDLQLFQDLPQMAACIIDLTLWHAYLSTSLAMLAAKLALKQYGMMVSTSCALYYVPPDPLYITTGKHKTDRWFLVK